MLDVPSSVTTQTLLGSYRSTNTRLVSQTNPIRAPFASCKRDSIQRPPHPFKIFHGGLVYVVKCVVCMDVVASNGSHASGGSHFVLLAG